MQGLNEIQRAREDQIGKPRLSKGKKLGSRRYVFAILNHRVQRSPPKLHRRYPNKILNTSKTADLLLAPSLNLHGT